jgi:hypothetical protein
MGTFVGTASILRKHPLLRSLGPSGYHHTVPKAFSRIGPAWHPRPVMGCIVRSARTNNRKLVVHLTGHFSEDLGFEG